MEDDTTLIETLKAEFVPWRERPPLSDFLAHQRHVYDAYQLYDSKVRENRHLLGDHKTKTGVPPPSRVYGPVKMYRERSYAADLGLLDQVKGVMKDEIQQHPAWPWFNDVRGIGPIYAYLLCVGIGRKLLTDGDFSEGDLRRTANLDPTQSIKAVARDQGFTPLRHAIGKTARQLLMTDKDDSWPQRSWYRLIYVLFKQAFTLTNPDSSGEADGHRLPTPHQSAKARMKRLLLNHCFLALEEAFDLQVMPRNRDRTPLVYGWRYLTRTAKPHWEVAEYDREPSEAEAERLRAAIWRGRGLD